MVWLIVLGILALAVFSRGFRAILGVLVVLAVFGGAILLVFLRHQQTVHEQREGAARRRISLSEVALEDARLWPPQYGSSYQLRARARNHSTSHAVRSIDVTITLRDCAGQTAADDTCDIVGQGKESVYVRIPPGQVRDIDRSIYFNPAPMFRGRMSWSFAIEGVAADE
jgi:type II secretory pathway pseudopilin PulG